MKLSEQKHGQVMVISIAGRLDTTNFQELESRLVQLIDQGEKFLVINCENLEYISSSGLRVFLFTLKKVGQQKGKMALCGLNSNISEIFTIAGFSSYFNLAKDEAEAMTFF
ncbi:MAG: STAS domain-containing protein [Bacteroidetes bacterium]|nr:STAS domain-containing protein [Bacteroidota bacterium]